METTPRLPAQLQGAPFTLHMAHGWGLREHHIRAMNLVTPFRGVRSVSSPETLVERAEALGLVVRSSLFSHVSAALLHGLPVPAALADDLALHVLRRHELGPVRRPGVVGHVASHDRDYATVHGISTVGLADTWVDFGELIRPGVPLGLDDLIVLGDAVAHRLGSVAPLRQALARRVRPRGKLTLLEALPHIRTGSESPGETRLRLSIVRSGMPEPELNVPVIVDGLWLGRPDAQWRAQRLIGEYQGFDFHNSDVARAADAQRFRRFTTRGWRYVEVWADDMNSNPARESTMLTFAQHLGIPASDLTVGECHPRFFSNRMLELADIRLRRLRVRDS